MDLQICHVLSALSHTASCCQPCTTSKPITLRALVSFQRLEVSLLLQRQDRGAWRSWSLRVLKPAYRSRAQHAVQALSLDLSWFHKHGEIATRTRSCCDPRRAGTKWQVPHKVR